MVKAHILLKADASGAGAFGLSTLTSSHNTMLAYVDDNTATLIALSLFTR
jgi:hypothetical protein